VALMVDRRRAYRMGGAEGKSPLGRPKRRWEEHIKTDIQEVGWGHGLDCSGYGWGQVAGSCECGDILGFYKMWGIS